MIDLPKAWRTPRKTWHNERKQYFVKDRTRDWEKWQIAVDDLRAETEWLATVSTDLKTFSNA